MVIVKKEIDDKIASGALNLQDLVKQKFTKTQGLLGEIGWEYAYKFDWGIVAYNNTKIRYDQITNTNIEPSTFTTIKKITEEQTRTCEELLNTLRTCDKEIMPQYSINSENVIMSGQSSARYGKTENCHKASISITSSTVQSCEPIDCGGYRK